MTRRYTIAPGVARLRQDQPRRTPAKRITHWLTVTAQLVKPRKPKPVVAEQRLLL